MAGAAASLSAIRLMPGEVPSDPGESATFRALFQAEEDGRIIEERTVRKIRSNDDGTFSIVDRDMPLFEINVVENMVFLSVEAKMSLKRFSDNYQPWATVEFAGKSFAPRRLRTKDILRVAINA
jgi:hypothetical protein